MLTAITAALILAAPVADAADRFGHTRANDAQRAMLASFTTVRDLVWSYRQSSEFGPPCSTPWNCDR